MEDLLSSRPTNTFWIERFKQYRNLERLTRRIAVTLIERIDIYEDCRMVIRFKYQDSFERALAVIEGIKPEGGFPDGQKAQKNMEAV